MSIELYLSLLIVSTILTIILTGLFKRLLAETMHVFRTNMIVLNSSMIINSGICVIYRIFFEQKSISIMPVLRFIILIIHTWFMATLAYDKMMQAKRQYIEYEKYNICKKYREYEVNNIIKKGDK